MKARRVLGATLTVLVLGATAGATGAQAGGWVAAPADPRAGDTRTLDGDGAALAVGRDGTAAAAWAAATGAGAERVVQVARRPPGGSWATTTLTTVPNALTAGPPAVAVDAHGGITVAYIEGLTVRASYRPPGGAFGAVQDVSAPNAQAFSLAAGDGGGAIVAWRTSTTVLAAIRSNGAADFQAASPVSDVGLAIYGAPQAAMDAAGDVAVIWQRRYDPGGGARYVTETAVKGVTQAWPTTAPGRIALSSTGAGNSDTYYHHVAMTPNGSLVALWDYRDDSLVQRVYVRDRPVGGGGFAAGAWSPASVPISAPNGGYGDLGVDDAGTAFAAWNDPSTLVVSGVRPPLGAFADAPIGSNGASGATRVSVAPAGDATFAWLAATGSDRDLVAARRPVGGAIGAPTRLLTVDGTGGAHFLSGSGLGTDDQGNAYAIVTDKSVGGVDTVSVFAYDNAAPVLGGLSAPDATTAGQAATFTAGASDRVDTAPSIGWDFGDGASATGGSVTHAYAAAGTYTAKVTATDAAGNVSSQAKVVTVAAPSVGPGGPGKVGPPIIVEPTKPPRVGAKAGAKFKRLRGGRTAFTKLTLSGLKKGDAVKLSCTGGGCASLGKKAKRVTAKKGSLDLLPSVKGLKLAPKAKLTILVSRKAYTSVKITYTMVRGKDPRRTLA